MVGQGCQKVHSEVCWACGRCQAQVCLAVPGKQKNQINSCKIHPFSAKQNSKLTSMQRQHGGIVNRTHWGRSDSLCSDLLVSQILLKMLQQSYNGSTQVTVQKCCQLACCTRANAHNVAEWRKAVHYLKAAALGSSVPLAEPDCLAVSPPNDKSSLPTRQPSVSSRATEQQMGS